MSEVRIPAEPRTEFGKGGARRTRRAGNVPAVLYGHGEAPRHISLPARDFANALKGEAGANVLLSLEIGDGTELALPKSIQRDPLRGNIEHVDLLLVRRGEKVTVDVAVTLSGEANRDALVDQQITTLSVEAEATHIPDSFEVSIDGMRVGDSVTASAVPLPAGTTLITDPETVVVQMLGAPSAEAIEADLAGAEAELGAGAAGAGADAGAPEQTRESGQGDVVPDTDSAEGGPVEPANAAEPARS